MFAEMRSALAISATTDILTHIYALPPSQQPSALSSIRAIESTAMLAQQPQPGLLPLMEYLERRGIQKGICTRNFDVCVVESGPVSHLLTKFLAGKTFSPIITRDFRPPKPHPAGIEHIARSWGLDDRGERLIMVGDSIDDMTAGHRAGAATVLLVNEVNAHLVRHEHTDLVVERLDELVAVLEEGFLGREFGGEEEGEEEDGEEEDGEEENGEEEEEDGKGAL
ncbi:hypothetical protein MMC12_004370 [Toensbergia leucococca]|nr:hypothetical protein [Toensbergia leucococca]